MAIRPSFLHRLAIIQTEQQQFEQASESLQKSLRLFPFIFAAWEQFALVSSLLQDPKKTASLGLEKSSFSPFSLYPPSLNALFQAYLISRRPFGQIDWLGADLALWRDHRLFTILQATYYYNRRDFEHAEALLTPYLLLDNKNNDDLGSLDGADILSDILFLRRMPDELYMLAMRCLSLDKYRPETSYVHGNRSRIIACATILIIGNFYALLGKHQQAALCFRRAIRADGRYAPAWILIAQQYVELRKPEAAIDCYRRATELRPTDHRAWYGLGQLYELLDVPLSAIEYYCKAAALCSQDARLWSALAGCYVSSGMHIHALQALQNALACPHRHPSLLLRLGTTLLALGRRPEAVEHFRAYLEEDPSILQQDTIEDAKVRTALLEVAKLGLTKKDSKAILILNLLARSHGQESLEARRLLSDRNYLFSMQERKR